MENLEENTKKLVRRLSLVILRFVENPLFASKNVNIGTNVPNLGCKLAIPSKGQDILSRL